MKALMHALGGVLGFLLVATFVGSTLVTELLGSPESITLAKRAIFWSLFALVPLLAGVGATGMSMLGKRTEPKALAKQKRGPIAFMTSMFVLLPSAYFLSTWAVAGSFGTWFYAVQGVELAASSVVLFMIGANIRDGLMLRGRIGGGAAKTPTIEARSGGPLVTLRLPVLNNPGGQSLPAGATMALCRCGKSKNKPFCDGSHNEFDFDTAPSDDRSKDEILIYEGQEVAVHYNRLLCSHAAECGRRQKAAFDSSRTPWIVPDNATAEGIMEVVEACPSGALRYALPGEPPQQARSGADGITVEKDGPYRVNGIPLAAADMAEGANRDKYVLCRCGASKNKPYCDGSHFDIGWKAS